MLITPAVNANQGGDYPQLVDVLSIQAGSWPTSSKARRRTASTVLKMLSNHGDMNT